jgi:hypothetical protein
MDDVEGWSVKPGRSMLAVCLRPLVTNRSCRMLGDQNIARETRKLRSDCVLLGNLRELFCLGKASFYIRPVSMTVSPAVPFRSWPAPFPLLDVAQQVCTNQYDLLETRANQHLL